MTSAAVSNCCRAGAEEEQTLAARCRSIVGLDWDFEALKEHANIRRKVRGDMSRLPFKSDSFDLVTANMVVERLREPDLQFREVSRVLRPGGIFLLHTPSAYGYPTAAPRFVPRAAKLMFVPLLERA